MIDHCDSSGWLCRIGRRGCPHVVDHAQRVIEDVETATTTGLLTLTPSFGIQYLMWQAPSATARPTPLSIPLQIVLGAFAAIFYLPMNMLTQQNWVMASDLMMLISLFVIVFMVAALPWQRRKWQPPAVTAQGRTDRPRGLTPAPSGDPRM